MKLIKITVEIPDGMQEKVNKYTVNLINKEIKDEAKREQEALEEAQKKARAKAEEQANQIIEDSFPEDTLELVTALAKDPEFTLKLNDSTKLDSFILLKVASLYILDASTTSPSTLIFVNSILDTLTNTKTLSPAQSSALQRTFTALIKREVKLKIKDNLPTDKE